jgi:hypothetical protein
MNPEGDGKNAHYVAAGAWNLLGGYSQGQGTQKCAFGWLRGPDSNPGKSKACIPICGPQADVAVLSPFRRLFMVAYSAARPR